ncbi:MAG: hypothetical protein HZB70_01475 [Candidatus Berkelbacteria bacterium]|nr:MAG: hypothetical protein HZB70_01475 [Candidatus Berkelbacteria bacterium]QQG51995.1 MAG: hypothetical protein HY845_01520 [Candidatus Berkelbacteria bacterium]
MKHLKRPYTASNEWLLKEAARLVFPDHATSIKNCGSGIIEVFVPNGTSRLVIGRVDLSERRPVKKRFATVCYRSFEIAFVINNEGHFWPLKVETEWIEDKETV